LADHVPLSCSRAPPSIYLILGNAQGKTTITANLAGALAANGARVLMIDADGQGNLTSLFNDGDNASVSEADIRKVIARREQLQGAAGMQPGEPLVPTDNIMEKCDPVQMAAFRSQILAGPTARVDCIDDVYKSLLEQQDRSKTQEVLEDKNNGLIRQVNIHDPLDDATNNKTLGGRLWMMPGGGSLQTFDSQFNEAQSSATRQSFSGTRNPSCFTLGLFSYMIRKLVQRENFDFVIVDFNPAVSSMNRIMAMSLDFLLPPVFADSYSSSSLSGLLETVLPQWYRWRQAVVQLQEQQKQQGLWSGEDEEWMMPQMPPQILPFLATNYSFAEDENNPHPFVDVSSIFLPRTSVLTTERTALTVCRANLTPAVSL
jgi:cellulose biosynthesis protein BcsQ